MFKVTITMPDNTESVYSTMPINFDSCTGAQRILVEGGGKSKLFEGEGLIAYNAQVAIQGDTFKKSTIIVGKVNEDDIEQLELQENGTIVCKIISKTIYSPDTLQNIAIGDA